MDLAKRVQSEVNELAKTIGHAQKPAYYDEILGFVTLKGSPNLLWHHSPRLRSAGLHRGGLSACRAGGHKRGVGGLSRPARAAAELPCPARRSGTGETGGGNTSGGAGTATAAGSGRCCSWHHRPWRGDPAQPAICQCLLLRRRYPEGRSCPRHGGLRRGDPLNPQFADAFYFRGLAHLNQGDLARAIADYDEAIRLNPQFADAFYYRGDAHVEQGDFARAVADYDEVIRLDPQNGSALFQRAVAQERAQSVVARRFADRDEAIRLNPLDANAFYNRGVDYAAQGDPYRAIADFSETLRLDPLFNQAFGARCRVRARADIGLAAARADCDKALSFPHGTPDYLNSRGLVGIRQGQFAGAWSDYDAALRAEPEEAHHLYGRGIAAVRPGRTAEGEADLARAAQLDANIAAIYAGYRVAP